MGVGMKLPPRALSCIMFLFSVFICSDLAGSTGETSSMAAARAGEREMLAGNYVLAEEHFQAALMAAGSERDRCTANYMLGKVHNRQGKFRRAYRFFSQSGRLLKALPDANYELGWNLLARKKYAAAVKRLEAYEEQCPGESTASCFLGRAYLGLGQLDKAEYHLREAINRNPARAATPRLFLARIATLRGSLGDCVSEVRELMGAHPDSPLVRGLQRRIRSLTVAADRPWAVRASGGVGYNNNVIHKHDDFPVPAGAASESSPMFELELQGTYRKALGQASTLQGGYILAGAFFSEDGPDAFNTLDHYLYGRYARRVTPRMAAALRVSERYIQLGGEGFHNELSASPSITFAETRRTMTEVTYTLSLARRLVDTAPAFDLDGHSHAIAATQHLLLPEYRTNLRGGVAVRMHDTESSDFDKTSLLAFAGVWHTLPARVTGVAYAAIVADRYSDANSLSATGADRSDDIVIVDLRASRPLGRRLTVYGDMQFRQNGSNVTFYDYDSIQFTAGVEHRW